MLPSMELILAFAASVFLNSHFLNSSVGSPSAEQTTAVYAFPEGAVNVGGDNVVTVLHVSLPPSRVGHVV
jgi:hypothetical protein